MYKVIKRFFDILSSLIAILLLSPLFIIVIFILRFSAEGEVFYLQKRIGLNNQIFSIFKFVTMVKNSPNIGSGIYTSANDRRILPFGKFLRKTKINELPQLFNILFGSMSVIGPRPLIEETFLLYENNVQSIVYKNKPGLSGIASIFFRDEENLLLKSNLPLEEFYKLNISPIKGRLESWYNKKISFSLDCTIIFMTLWVIFFPKSDILFKFYPNLQNLIKN